MRNLVDPASKGAQEARKLDLTPKQMALNIKNGFCADGQKRIHHEDQIKSKLDQQKSNLPKIKAGSLSYRDDPSEPIKPLKEITVNYKTKDIDFLNFKKKHSVSPQKFGIEINQMKGESPKKKKTKKDVSQLLA